MAPLDEIVKLFPTLDAANTVAILFVRDTLFVAPLLDNVIAPVNTFALFNVMALAPELKLDVPGTVNTPV